MKNCLLTGTVVLMMFWGMGNLIAAGDGKIYGDVKVSILDDSTIALTVLYDRFFLDRLEKEHSAFLKSLDRQVPKIKDWSRRFFYSYAAANLRIKYRPEIAALLQDYGRYRITGNDGKPLAFKETSYWVGSTGQTWLPDFTNRGKEVVTNNADVAYYVFFKLDQPLRAGVKYQVVLPSGERADFQYGPESISLLFKLDQLGFSPRAGRKYGYIGAWLGDGGALDIRKYFDRPFELVNAVDGKTVWRGIIRERLADAEWKDGIQFTGEIVGELDFSDYKTPGRYYLQVAGIGRSREFKIDDDVIGEAFYTHARGLYHKRCGIAKEKPYTNWPLGACHQTVIRGNFPPNDRHYKPDKKPRGYGFFDEAGKEITVKHFDLIRQNQPVKPEVLPIKGGWHDAGDYDRRPYHFHVVDLLLGAYFINPEAFLDNQLNIPESGNGIPDLLDEVLYGMNMWRSAQNPDGGVGTWLESYSHPEEPNPALDQAPYFLSLATRESSLEYAAHAAMTALALRKAGQDALAKTFQESADRAYQFAMDEKNKVEVRYNYTIDGKKTTITYRDNPELPIEWRIKAGMDLYFLTGDDRYLDDIYRSKKECSEALNAISWKYAPLMFIELEIFGSRDFKVRFLCDAYWRAARKSADEHLAMLDDNYQYRVPWYGPKHGYVSHMSWSNSHPLRRATYLALGWLLFGDQKYLDGMFLANNWHNGGNPLGITMTSGLGEVYPARFLDLPSYADGIGEFVPGITPYRHTFAFAREDVNLVHGLYYKARKDHQFEGAAISMMPDSLRKDGDTDQMTRDKLSKLWPIWRRNVILEGLSVSASEFTVWETIAPAAAMTGVLLGKDWHPSKELKERKPHDRLEDLPGYAPLP